VPQRQGERIDQTAAEGKEVGYWTKTKAGGLLGMCEYGGRPTMKYGRIAAAIGLTFVLTGVCLAEDVAPFRLTGIDGYAAINYLSDTERRGDGGTTSKLAIATLQEEVFLNTHSYFYHPNFLKMDLGGGPLFVQDRYEVDGVINRESSDLYSLVGRLSFLEQKPYPFAVYYEHLNPTVTTSLTQSFTQTNTKTGATFSLREPLSPVLVDTEVFHQRSEGRSTTYVVDDDNEQASVRLSSNFGADGYGQLFYQLNRLQSASGNPDLPILSTQVESRTASFDGRFLFGAQRELTYTQAIGMNTLSFVRPGFLVEREDFRFSPDLRWQHSDSLTSFYNYSLYKSNETTVAATTVEATNQTARAGLANRVSDRLSATADVHARDDRITGLELRSYGAGVQGGYTRPWEDAVLRLNAGLIYDQSDREATAALINVTGESITLVDAIPVTLAQEFIDTATIRVFNLSRTQEYTLTDYRIIVIGSRTQIQRLATGTILDGQTVLVDYAFQTGGSAGFRYLSQSYLASLTLYRYYTVYTRYFDADYRLTSGAPTLPLNSSRNTLYGLRVDQPLVSGATAGVEAMFERQEEEISSYRRQSYDAYLQLPVWARTSTRLSARRLFVEYANSPEDVDLTGWTLQLGANLWTYTSLTAETTYEEDTGGSLPRVIVRDSLGIEWRFRQLSIRGEGQYIREEQGTFERDRTVFRLTARREF